MFPEIVNFLNRNISEFWLIVSDQEILFIVNL